jgi:orotidine-5'-phosphate decarboxylase
MQRGGESLPEDVKKYDWTMNYIKNIAPYCSGLKFNINYWKGAGDTEILKEAADLARSKEMVVIEDSKLTDIGSTNDAGFYYAEYRADAVTVAPFAGNLKEMKDQAKTRNIGLISMCLMSNPEYMREKNKFVPLGTDEVFDYSKDDIKFLNSAPFVKQYKWLANNARKHDIDGIVIGAPSSKNHITTEEIKKVKQYAGGRLILIPGIGKQGGEAGVLFRYFLPDNCIANVGRALMFPEDGDQEAAAKYYFKMLNDLRAGK